MATTDTFLEIAANLARYHREHEIFYARAPLEQALSLERTSAALRALAERWTRVDPSPPQVASPYSGAEDINDERAIETAGILFIEGGEEPAEIHRIKRELIETAGENDEAGEWLASAMETSWTVVEALISYPELADQVAERHAIIINDWQAASLARLIARQLERAVAILERIDFSSGALREDLSGPRHTPALLFAACELIDRAADMAAQSGSLVHRNERRWRVFRDRVESLVRDAESNSDESNPGDPTA